MPVVVLVDLTTKLTVTTLLLVQLLPDGVSHTVAVRVGDPARAHAFEALMTEQVHGKYEVLPNIVGGALLVAPPRLHQRCCS